MQHHGLVVVDELLTGAELEGTAESQPLIGTLQIAAAHRGYPPLCVAAMAQRGDARRPFCTTGTITCGCTAYACCPVSGSASSTRSGRNLLLSRLI